MALTALDALGRLWAETRPQAKKNPRRIKTDEILWFGREEPSKKIMV